MSRPLHQSQLPPAANKFHVGNGEDQKHYWLTPPDIYAALDAEFRFDSQGKGTGRHIACFVLRPSQADDVKGTT